jgi:hypothetical protein
VSAARTKSLSVRIKSAGDPSEAQLALIRQYTLADMAADQLYVRTFAIAHNAIDRDREAFDEALLADFARTLPGKGLFVKHPNDWANSDRGAPGEGRWFDAHLERMSLDEARKLLREPELKFPPGAQTAVLLMADGYMARTAGNADLLLKIDAGVVGDVSIGFTAKDYERITDEHGNELNAYRLLGPGEALEASLVWLGAQPGARAIKGASIPDEDDNVETNQKLAAAEQKATTLQTQLDEATPSHNLVIGLRKALGDNAHLVDKPEVLSDQVKAAGEFRKSLVDDIVAAERQLGVCGDSDEAVKAAEAIYAGYDTPKLQQLHKHYAERTPKGGRMAPSTPVRGAGAEDAAAGQKSVLDSNPAFA